MRKIICAFTVMLAGCSVLSAQPNVRVPALSGPAGSLLVAPILITPGSGLTALEVTVQLPQGITLFNSALRRGDALTDHSFSHSVLGNEVQIVIFSTSLAPFRSGGGSVVQLLLTVGQQVSDGSRLPLRILEALGSNVAGEALAVGRTDGEVTISGMVSVPVDGQNRLIFPQVGNGTFAGGSFSVTAIAVNLTDAPASARIRYFRSDATPFPITLTGGETRSDFVLDLPAGGAAFLESNGQGPIGAGYAVLDASAPIGGSLLFTIRNPTGQRISEAGVGNSPVGRNFVIPVGFRPNSVDTGLAIANFGASASITLTLKDPSGNELESTMIQLSAGNHTAQFSSQFFATIGQLAQFEGSIEISSNQPISVISLRQFAGGLLTTLPVTPLEP